jgi:arsenate reductase
METNDVDVTIYHNPLCGTSRNTLALIRNAGIEPKVIEYLKTPPDLAALTRLIQDAGLTVRDALREKEAVFVQLELADATLTDEQLLDAMLAHPILINRPFVVTPEGTRLCRPSEKLLEILSVAQKGPFAKEDGERIIDEKGNRVR